MELQLVAQGKVHSYRMGGSFKIGRAFGIDVKVHWTFFLLLAFFAFLGFRNTQSPLVALVTALVVVALFFCVLLHEFGHSLVAQRLGLEVPDITLLPIGGLARLKSLPDKPADEVKIAIAGPLVNVVLAPIFFAVASLLGANLFAPPDLLGGVGSVGEVIVYLGYINVALAVFNLIPAFPMDGGRVLRGLLATRLGPVRATDISSSIGQLFAIGFFVLGFLSNPFLILIAVFIFFGASGEAQMVRQRELMQGLAVSDVMGTKPRTETITPYHNFGQVLDSVIHGYQEDFPVVDEDGKLVGIITRNEILSAAHSPDRYASVRDLMKPDVPTISPDADLFMDGYRVLQESGLRAIPVTKSGELVGMLTIDDIGQASLLRDLRKQQF
ncbi:MAG: site-2 protease family protein [Actinomycetota bacterium]|jgi:Zn-dependent protease/CBS domain-containing protein|nr:site-2 protease family protein [Actinomycetota bacterium]